MKAIIKYAAPYDINTVARGEWIDLQACLPEPAVNFNAGDYKEVSLGLRMILPAGIEAYVASRSSTYKRYGVIMAGGVGIIDSGFNGWDDVWTYPALSINGGTVFDGDRIAQFRLQPSMLAPSYIKRWWAAIDEIVFLNVGVDETSPDVIEWQREYRGRGGLGSTGR